MESLSGDRNGESQSQATTLQGEAFRLDPPDQATPTLQPVTHSMMSSLHVERGHSRADV